MNEVLVLPPSPLFGPESCPGYESCAAPLCPRDAPTLKGGQWFVGEPVCCARAFVSVPWLRTQKRIARVMDGQGAEAGYFTVGMLSTIQRVTKGVRGVDPDGRAGEYSWQRQREAGVNRYGESSHMPPLSHHPPVVGG